MRVLVERGWPPRHIDLLVCAFFAPEAKARAAWATWKRERGLENVGLHELRLFAPLSVRMDVLEPSSSLRARIKEIAQAHLTRTQLVLHQTMPALNTLIESGIEILLFKGAAQYAEAPRRGTRRVIGDVDVLVKSEQFGHACETLLKDGWACLSCRSVEELREAVQQRLSITLQKGQFGLIDLQRSAFYFSRHDDDLDAALWSHARKICFKNLEVFVPSPTDNILISIANGIRDSKGEWAIDVSKIVSFYTIDWDRFVDVVERRGLVPSILSGLSYLQLCGVPIPEPTIKRLSELKPRAGELLKYFSSIGHAGTIKRGRLEKLVDRVADVRLSHQNYDCAVEDKTAVPIIRPDRLALRLGGKRVNLPSSANERRRRHEFQLDLDAEDCECRVRVALKQPPYSRKLFLDVSADGFGIARLLARFGRDARSGEHFMEFTFRLPFKGARLVTLTIETSRYAAGVTRQAARFSPLEASTFRVFKAWTI